MPSLAPAELSAREPNRGVARQTSDAMKASTRILLPSFLLVFLLSASPSWAEDVAILWDISKSVPNVMYDERVHNGVKDLVLGKGLASGWDVTRPEPIDASVEGVLSGKRPMVRERDRILVVHFGSLKRESRIKNLPFSAWEFIFQREPDIAVQVLQAFPLRATDSWTNKNLAEAAAARYFYDRGSPAWFLIMISDFDQDNKEHLTPIERQFVDTYEAQRFVSVTPPVVMRWKENPRVIVKLKRALLRGKVPDLPTLPGRLLELLSPANGAKVPADRRLVFSWRWNGEKSPRGYQMIVTRAEPPRGTVLSKASQVSSVTADKALLPGNYRWQVFALLEDGSISSQALPFSVEGGGGWGWIMVVLLVAAAVGALLYLNMRRQKRAG